MIIKMTQYVKTFLMIMMMVMMGVGCMEDDTNLQEFGEGLKGLDKSQVTNLTLVNISNVADFEKIRSNPFGSFLITKNINFSGKQFNPIRRFYGTLDGNGKTLQNVIISDLNLNIFGGIFRAVIGEVKDLTLQNFNVTGNDYIGLLAGELFYGGKLTNIKVVNGTAGTISSVSGRNYVGGLVGKISNSGAISSSISCDENTPCPITVNVVGENNVGGLVGLISQGSNATPVIKNNGMTVDVQGSGNNIGGLVGFVESATKFDGGYLGGIVAGASTSSGVGGLIGNFTSQSNKGSIDSSFVCTLTVTGGSKIGGIVGSSNNLNISNTTGVANVRSISTGSGEYVGGIVGEFSNGDLEKVNFSDGLIIGVNNIGGVVGSFSNGSILRSQSSSDVIIEIAKRSSSYVGGLVGKGSNFNIEDSASSIQINLPSSGSNLVGIGGLVGWAGNPNKFKKLENSYFNGLIQGTIPTPASAQIIGSFVGEFAQVTSPPFSITNSYSLDTSRFDFIKQGPYKKDSQSGKITKKKLDELIKDGKVGPNTKGKNNVGALGCGITA